MFFSRIKKQHMFWLGIMAHTWNPSTRGAKVGGSPAQVQPTDYRLQTTETLVSKKTK